MHFIRGDRINSNNFLKIKTKKSGGIPFCIHLNNKRNNIRSYKFQNSLRKNYWRSNLQKSNISLLCGLRERWESNNSMACIQHVKI